MQNNFVTMLMLILGGLVFIGGGLYFILQKPTLEKKFVNRRTPLPLYGPIGKILGIFLLIIGLILFMSTLGAI
ncbi:hypothetical protein [Lactococcus fujiensis]|uniref:Uncharacterized protein n=1 Tax=Lactococcus fujiensis JCM 16395 TaxID=1291764 RepID=A0A2A5RKQ2_9LACT|nr:hypothetical protein [Lactococcus fujiensis]PCR99781.1 hypothetical protein RT41_GL001587 [Lactococcus fujiensis JCM 16395]